MHSPRVSLRVFRVARFLGFIALLGSIASAQRPVSARVQPQSLLAREVIAAHNSVRSRLGVPPLVWSDQMARLAQDWADTLLVNGAFQHRPNNPYGENLFESGGFDATPFYVVNAWAAEAANYRYATNTCFGVCGHYTQVVWRDTKAVGCGVARDARHEVWVCNYAPYGNIIGERPY